MGWSRFNSSAKVGVFNQKNLMNKVKGNRGEWRFFLKILFVLDKVLKNFNALSHSMK